MLHANLGDINTDVGTVAVFSQIDIYRAVGKGGGGGGDTTASRYVKLLY